MKKRILCALLALTLLCALTACKKEQPPTPPGGQDAPTGGFENGTPPSGETTPDASEQFETLYGYPYGFSLHFACTQLGGDPRGKGFDTLSSNVFNGFSEHEHNYADQLYDLYQDLLRANIYALPADLTARTLSGNTHEASADNITYSVTFTAKGATYSVITDSDAFASFAGNSNVSNVRVLMLSLELLADQHLAAATAT